MKPQLYQYIKQVLKPYQRNILGFLTLGLVWACLNTLTPYVLKLLIDKAVNFQGPVALVFSALKPFILIYTCCWLLQLTNFRLIDFIKLKTFPSIRQAILSSQFSYLIQHEYIYFQNHFAGNLANKIVDLQGGIVNILSIIDDCYSQIMALTIAIITLMIVHPIFAIILFI